MDTNSDAPEDETGAVLTKDALILDDALTQRVRRKELSPSTSKTFLHNCHAQWAFGKISGGSKPDIYAATDQGTVVHSVLEHLYNQPKGKRTKRKAMNILLTEIVRLRGSMYPELKDPVTQAIFVKDIASKYEGMFDIEDPRLVDVYSTEQRIHDLVIGGVPFTGSIDLTERITARGRKGLRISDFKTSKTVPDKRKKELFGDEHGDQIRLYVAAMRQLVDEEILEGRVYYVRHGKKEIVAVSDQRVKKVVGEFQRAWEVHNTSVASHRFATKVGALCGWCPLVRLCPAARAEGLVDRTDSQTALKGTPLLTIHNPAPDPAHTNPSPPTGNSEPDPSSQRRTETSDRQEEGTMADPTHFASREGKPYDGAEDNEGNLDGNSYSATAVSDIAAMAYEQLHKANVPVQRIAIDTFATTLAAITLQVQRSVKPSDPRWQDGTNNRVRVTLRAFLDSNPAPFGGTEEQWQIWIKTAVGHTVSILQTGLRIYAAGTDLKPDVATLATITPKNTQEGNPWQ